MCGVCGRGGRGGLALEVGGGERWGAEWMGGAVVVDDTGGEGVRRVLYKGVDVERRRTTTSGRAGDRRRSERD